MKLLWRIGKEAKRYRLLLITAALSTLTLTGLNLISPRLLSNMVGMVSDGVDEDKLREIGMIAAALFSIAALRIAFRFMSNYLAHKAAWKLVHEIRLKVYRTIQSFSMEFFHNKQTGELMSRVTNDTAQFELLYAHIMPDMVTNIVTLVGVTVILFTINPLLAALTCIPVPFILVMGWLYSKKVRPKFRQMQKTQGEMNAQLQDNLSGVKEIQAFGQQKRASGKFMDKSWTFTDTMLRALKISAVFHPSVEFFTSLGSVIVVGFGGWFAYRNQISVADVVGFLLYLSLFYAPITGLSNLLESVAQSLAGAERVIEILDTPIKVNDAPDAKEIGITQGGITFENVGFSYIEGVPVLKDVSLEIKPGMMVALIGATGVGKTTITQLVSRFYDPTEGDIYIDGHNLRDITLESLHKNISVVLQDTFLFNGTIAENIAFAVPNATFKEVEEVAKIARIHSDIMEMPDKYDTQIGERGTKLSGGQKQRVAIARAILCKAPVLILDEATASLDTETEKLIQDALNRLSENRTTIAIAHRLSTLRNADKLLVLDKGKVAEFGTHNELLEQQGIYYKLVMAQREMAHQIVGEDEEEE